MQANAPNHITIAPTGLKRQALAITNPAVPTIVNTIGVIIKPIPLIFCPKPMPKSTAIKNQCYSVLNLKNLILFF